MGIAKRPERGFGSDSQREKTLQTRGAILAIFDTILFVNEVPGIPVEDFDEMVVPADTTPMHCPFCEKRLARAPGARLILCTIKAGHLQFTQKGKCLNGNPEVHPYYRGRVERIGTRLRPAGS